MRLLTLTAVAALTLAACNPTGNPTRDKLIDIGVTLACDMTPLVVAAVLTNRGVPTHDQAIIQNIFAAGCAIRSGRDPVPAFADTLPTFCGVADEYNLARYVADDTEWKLSERAACDG